MLPATTVSSRRVFWTMAGVCALGALLRLWAINYGLPGLYHPDETPILNRALTFAKGDPNPHNFLYPTLHFYVLFVWQGLFFVAGWLTGVFASVDAFQAQFFVDPSYHFIAGRALTALLGTLTIVAIYWLARRLHSQAAGVAAACFLAVAPFAVRDAHYVKLDVPVGLMTALAHVAIARLIVDAEAAARLRSWIAAGVLGGLALSTQYYVAPLVAAFIAAAVVHAKRSGDWTTAFRLLVGAGLAFIVGFFAGTPFILTELQVTARDIAEVRQVNFERALDTGGPLSSIGPYISMLATDALGWPVFVLAVVGAAATLWRDWGRGLLLVTFPVAYLVFISNTVPMSRYLACVVPLVAAAAGIGLMELVSSLRPKLGAARTSGFAVVLVLIAGLPGLLLSIRSNLFFAQDDTRGLAKAFIEQQVPADATILIQPQSAPLHMSRPALVDALRLHLGDESRASVKFQYQMAATPYPAPAYRLVFLGDGGQDVDRTYVSLRGFTGSLDPLRAQGIEYVVMKRTNVPNPDTALIEQALERGATRMATFSPYRPGLPLDVQAATAPYFHNTATRIVPELDRPGPTVDIWKIQ